MVNHGDAIPAKAASVRETAPGLISDAALEYLENLDLKIIRQIKVDHVLGMYLPLGDEMFIVAGNDHNGLDYLLFSERPSDEFQFETYDPFGKKFPGLLAIISDKNRYLIPFSPAHTRVISINKSGDVQTRDLIGDGLDYRKKIHALLSDDANADTFYSLLSSCLKESVEAVPWQLPEVRKVVNMRPRQKPDTPIHQTVDVNRIVELFPISPERQAATKFVRNRQKKRPGDYKSEFEVEKHIRLMSPNAESVTSPYHLAIMEQLRGETSLKKYPLQEILTDLMVFNAGEPPNRAVSKIGGLPYWPREKAWPTDEVGNPLVFIGQLNFLDSVDHIGPLPGDILLVFGHESLEEYMMPQEDGSLHFFWQNISEDQKLVQADDQPGTEWQLLPVWGDMHRTREYVAEQELELPDEEEHVHDLLTWQGTKIGGEPHWIQEEECIGSRFIGSIGTVDPKTGQPFPFLNREVPIEWGAGAGDYDSANFLMWGGGTVEHSISSWTKMAKYATRYNAIE